MTALLDHAASLPVAAEVRPEVAAIEQNRGLLSDPDPVPDLVEKLTAALRSALNQAHAACTSAHEGGLASLEASATWQKLSPEQRYDLLSKSGSRVVPTIAVGTTEEILETPPRPQASELEGDRPPALPTRFSASPTAAAKLLEPQAQASQAFLCVTIPIESDLEVLKEAEEEQIFGRG